MTISPTRLIRRVTCAALSLVCFATCGMLLPSNVVHITFPDVPEEIGSDLESWQWITDFAGHDGTVTRCTTPLKTQSIRIILPRGTAMPVTAYLAFIDSTVIRTRPAGAVYPSHAEGVDRMALQWETGFAADTLLRVHHARDLFSGFNVTRFCNEILERSDGMPWNLDQEYLVQRLTEASFSVYAMRPTDDHQLDVAIPAGVWLNWDVVSPSIIGDDSAATQLNVREGYTRLYCPGCGENDWEWIAIFCSADGYLVSGSVTEEISVGRW